MLSKLVLLLLPLALAMPQRKRDTNPPGYCMCLSPGDGVQDIATTQKVCSPSFKERVSFSTFLNVYGVETPSCSPLGFGDMQAFATACIGIYGEAGNDGQAGSLCCDVDPNSGKYGCDVYPPSDTDGSNQGKGGAKHKKGDSKHKKGDSKHKKGESKHKGGARRL